MTYQQLIVFLLLLQSMINVIGTSKVGEYYVKRDYQFPYSQRKIRQAEENEKHQNGINSVSTGEEKCSAQDCNERGTCVGSKRMPLCLCTLGYAGTHCQDTFCDPSKHCSGRGWCVGTSSQYACMCNLGFTGDHCDREVATLTAATPFEFTPSTVTPLFPGSEHSSAVGSNGDQHQHFVMQHETTATIEERSPGTAGRQHHRTDGDDHQQQQTNSLLLRRV